MGINIGRGKGGTQEDEDEVPEAKQTVKAGESTVSLLVILMQNNKNVQVTSASQISLYVQNVRSLNPSITSQKFTWPLDTKCDVYIFVDARVTELRLSTLQSNFKVSMSDMQCYNTNSRNRGILILCKKSSGCTIENAELVDKDSTVIFDLKGEHWWKMIFNMCIRIFKTNIYHY